MKLPGYYSSILDSSYLNIKFFLYHFQDDLPGDEWLMGFLARWNLSVKLPSTMEKARKVAASDPEIIYGFYDLLENQYKANDIL